MRLLLPVAVAVVTLGLAVPQVAVAAPTASACVTPQFADGLAQSVLSDATGTFGRAVQLLYVDAR